MSCSASSAGRPDEHGVRDDRAGPAPGPISATTPRTPEPGQAVELGHVGQRAAPAPPRRRPPPVRSGVPSRARPLRPCGAPCRRRRRPRGGRGCSSIVPVVTVPVLSSTTVSTRRVDSRTSGPLMSTPSCAPRPVPTSSAVGVASPRAHGHAMISTATAAVKALAVPAPAPSQNPSVATASAMTTGTNTADTRSARRCACGLAVLRVLDQPGHAGELGVACRRAWRARSAGRRS